MKNFENILKRKEEEIKELEAEFRDALNPFNDDDTEYRAWRMVEIDGWHKQTEAEWVMKLASVVCYKCSNCDGDLPFGMVSEYTPYCPHCGAKMKGAI